MEEIRKVYYNILDKRPVTAFYYDIILEAFERAGYIVLTGELYDNEIIRTLDKKRDVILYTQVKYTPLLKIKGFKNLVFWFQGVTPEEVYLMFGSRLKLFAFTILEKMTLNVTRFSLMVSVYQVEHYKKKYGNGWAKNRNVIVMPCFNTSRVDKEAVFKNNKYKNNVFCYSGGMAKWQCFDRIAKIYSEVEKRKPESFLKVLTFQTEEAIEIIKGLGIKHYSVYSVPPEKVSEELSECKFGFILREDNVINNVATPTKFGNYIENGLIPIYTDATRSFADAAKDLKHVLCVTYDNAVEKICEFMGKDISPDDIYLEFSQLFSDYYNREKYIQQLKEEVNRL